MFQGVAGKTGIQILVGLFVMVCTVAFGVGLVFVDDFLSRRKPWKMSKNKGRFQI